jgi:hypothetical protein
MLTIKDVTMRPGYFAHPGIAPAHMRGWEGTGFDDESLMRRVL